MAVRTKNAVLNLFTSKYVTGIYIAVLLAFAGFFVFSNREMILNSLVQAQLFFLILAFLASAGNFLFGNFLSHRLYQLLGVNISYLDMLRILSISKMGRYMPGKIWYVSNYYLFSRRLGIAPHVIVKNYLITSGLALITALICSVPAIFFISLPLEVSKTGLVLIVLVLLCILHPKVLNYILRLVEYLLIKIRGQGLSDPETYFAEVPPSYLTLLACGFLICWLISGLVLYLTLSAFQTIPLGKYPVYLSASAFSQTVGLLAFFAPGGIGVRESVAMIILSPVVSLNIAMMAVVSLRIIHVVNVMIFGTVSLFSMKTFDSLKERYLVSIVLLRLAYLKMLLLARGLKCTSLRQHDCGDNEKFAGYLKQNFRSICNLDARSKSKEIKCSLFNNSYSHDTYLVEIMTEDPADGISKRKLVAKHYGIRGMYIRTKLNLIIYGREALKIGRFLDPQTIMKSEIEAGKKLARYHFNAPRIVYADFERKYIFTEFVDGERIGDLLNTIFYTKGRTERSDIKAFEKMGGMLAGLHNRCKIVHGEPTPNNWIYNREKEDVFLIDWESVSKNGDPGFDLAQLIYTIGKFARGLDGDRLYLYDEIVSSVLRGYDQSFTENENVGRIAGYWDNWILISPLHIQERVFNVLQLPSPRSFRMLRKITEPVFGGRSMRIRELFRYKIAGLLLVLYKIGYLLFGKSIRNYEIKSD